MTLEQIYYITQIVAVVGILVSLLLVLLQLRQTQKQLEQSQIQLEKTQIATEFSVELSVGEAVLHTLSSLSQRPEMRAIMRKARLAREPLTGDERRLYSNYLFEILMPSQTSYLAVLKGMGIDDLFISNSAIVCDVVNCDEGRRWVQRNGNRFDPRFRDYMAGLMGLGPIVHPGLPEGYPLPERHDLTEGGKWAGVTASSIS